MQGMRTALETLKQMYSTLIKSNEEFSNSEVDDESFDSLVNHRSVIIDDTEILIREIKQIIEGENEEIVFKKESFVEVLFKILELYPDLIELVNELNGVLTKLVETDKLVGEKIEEYYGKIKNEIGKVRKTSKSLKGYSQLDTYGSCFINKMK